MKAKEAINAIKCNMPTTGTYTVLTEALHLAIKVLEKQIPIEPLFYDNEHEECPKCSESIPRYIMGNETKCYCSRCGQLLDWAESEGDQYEINYIINDIITNINNTIMHYK